jgi:hypothetical protein
MGCQYEYLSHPLLRLLADNTEMLVGAYQDQRDRSRGEPHRDGEAATDRSLGDRAASLKS